MCIHYLAIRSDRRHDTYEVNGDEFGNRQQALLQWRVLRATAMGVSLLGGKPALPWRTKTAMFRVYDERNLMPRKIFRSMIKTLNSKPD